MRRSSTVESCVFYFFAQSLIAQFASSCTGVAVQDLRIRPISYNLWPALFGGEVEWGKKLGSLFQNIG